MKKVLVVITTLCLSNIGWSWSSPASANYSENLASHVDSKFEFPHNKWAIVRQTIQVHVSKNGGALAQLSIEIPDHIEFQASKVDITDINNRPIIAQTSMQGQKLQISFNTPIAAGTQIRINLNDVKRTMLVKSPLYYIFGKIANGSEAFIGEAYFPL